MNKIIRFVCLVCVALAVVSFAIGKKAPRVLIFSRTKGFHHASIPVGIAAVQKIGSENNFIVDTTTDASYFTRKHLKKYAVVIFLNTTGDVLNDEQQKAFQKYMRSGKGFVGVHAATDTEYEWPWYGKLVGAYYSSHPDIQAAALQKVDTAHISCKHLPDRWTRTDEWYNFKEAPKDVTVLLKLDEATYQGGTMGDHHPMAWYHTFEGGRAFYTALGHTVESYSDTLFLEHIRQGVIWASGK